MFGLKLVAAAAILAQGVLGEGIHLLNCRPFGGAGVSQTWLSIVAYCANDADCNSLQYSIPDQDACIVSSSGTSESYHHWEGSSQSCTFSSTGVTFRWNIPGNAQSQPNYSSVGTGSNGFKTFAGFKDDHSPSASYSYHSCEKIYYYV
ncbi:uncharacterized protein B0T15DRAFT_217630 [Chaetomium strumarium]|uniref:Uncharacterized protein n=1 Tax=Chaetomium strumarium TaxID=1170767 RepID=A0AAJ0GTU9_9PEZI|nr:hypothetical protein B0T15DRAFT_217630 [Chaetomium strumarium]